MDNMVKTLRSDRLSVELFFCGEENQGARYDGAGMVTQVTLDGSHTYLSREQCRDGSVGMGGQGLSGVFEWDEPSFYDQAGIADVFPMLGIGLVKKTSTAPFNFSTAYPVAVPFPREVFCTEDTCMIRTLPILCCGVAAEVTKIYSVENNTLSIKTIIENNGSAAIHAAEFNHNFFAFDGTPVDSNYQLTVPYQVHPKFRRGKMAVGFQTVQPFCFDKATESTALFLEGFAGLNKHWMKLEHTVLGTSILVEEDFPPEHIYLWSNPVAFCPETFCKIDLEPGEGMEYTRRYTFN